MRSMMLILGWATAGLLLLASFGVDYRNVAHGGSIDLRNRITGIRLLAHGIDAYHYKWKKPEPPEYCDPFNNPLMQVSKTTATPSLLLLHLPLAALPYRSGQIAWLFLQWLLLLGTAGLWLRLCTTSRQRWALVWFVVAFTYTAAWRLHAERGQSYVLLLFVFACWLAASLHSKMGNHFVTGLVAGFLVTLRPPFALLLPFLLLHRRGQLTGAAIGLLLGIGLPMLWSPSCWLDYASAMQTQADYYLTDYYVHYQQAYPSEIEGMSLGKIAHFAAIPYADFSVHAFLKFIGGESSWPGFLPLHLLIVAPFALWLWLTRKQRMEFLLLGIAAWFFLIDLFLPAYRNSYNDVLILNIVALGVIASNRLPLACWICLPALPIGWFIYAQAPEEPWLINLPTFFFTLGAALFLLFKTQGLRWPFGANRAKETNPC